MQPESIAKTKGPKWQKTGNEQDRKNKKRTIHPSFYDKKTHRHTGHTHRPQRLDTDCENRERPKEKGRHREKRRKEKNDVDFCRPSPPAVLQFSPLP